MALRITSVAAMDRLVTFMLDEVCAETKASTCAVQQLTRVVLNKAKLGCRRTAFSGACWG